MADNGAWVAEHCSTHGWKAVRLHGVKAPGVCTCWKGANCGTPGKHPVETAWELHATDDAETILEWFAAEQQPNVGILLGPKSGVIDIEIDSPEAHEAWSSLGLGDLETPTYTAGRGPHRLFRWQENLPPVQVKKVLGIECRLGNGGKASQSVMPPSVHHTGKIYRWVEGLGPDEVPLAPLPDRLVALLWNDDGTGAGGSPVGRSARSILHEPVMKADDGPGRNNMLYRFAVREAFRAAGDLDSPLEQGDMLAKLRAINATQCRPPLNDSEVVGCFRSAISYVRKSRASLHDPDSAMAVDGIVEPAEATAGGAKRPPAAPEKTCTVFSESGLAYAPAPGQPDSDPEWWPGEWTLTIVHSDPIEYRLHAPAWDKYLARGTGSVSLTVDQFRSATKVAAAVLAATGKVMLDKEPGAWALIWDGGAKVRDFLSSKSPRTRKTIGLKAKLLDVAAEEFPGASSLRYVDLATHLYDALANASQPNDDDAPDSVGRPCWRADGTLWFSWARVWAGIEQRAPLREGDRAEVKRRILGQMGGSTEFREGRFRHASGTRRRYVVWTRRELAALEAIAFGEDEVEATGEAEREEAGVP